MARIWLLIWLLLGAACGRIGFDDGGATGDGANGDGVIGGPVPPSCNALAPTCGPTSSSPCCESPVVTGGTYYRGYDIGTDNQFTDTAYPATVSTFRLDKYEVTVGRFRQFVVAGMGTQQAPPAAGAGAHAQIPGSGWDPSWNAMLPADTTSLMAGLTCNATYETWTNEPGANENRPINCMTWYEALAFCAWDGGFLPTEAEWNYVATGGTMARAFPWSSPASALAIDGSYASYGDGTDCVGDGMAGCALTDILPVGSKPAGDGALGHSDLGGNVWEFQLDWYTYPFAIATCNDCANLTPATDRVVRGGCFNCVAGTLRGALHSNWQGPASRGAIVGVRCGRPP